MKVIGLTGGIGSGKSTVAQIFMSLGIPVYFADDEAKTLMHRSPLKEKIEKAFGPESFKRNGDLDRQYLAQRVFQSKPELQRLNNLVHPAVREDFNEWVSMHDAAPYVMREAAILFESGSYKDCDLTISVSAPISLRLQRVVERDGQNAEHVKQRMANQWSDEQRNQAASMVIYNDGSQSLIKQVTAIHRHILST